MLTLTRLQNCTGTGIAADDMHHDACSQAISDALGAMESSASAEEMAEAAADAASTAYDRVAGELARPRMHWLLRSTAVLSTAAEEALKVVELERS